VTRWAARRVISCRSLVACGRHWIARCNRAWLYCKTVARIIPCKSQFAARRISLVERLELAACEPQRSPCEEFAGIWRNAFCEKALPGNRTAAISLVKRIVGKRRLASDKAPYPLWNGRRQGLCRWQFAGVSGSKACPPPGRVSGLAPVSRAIGPEEMAGNPTVKGKFAAHFPAGSHSLAPSESIRPGRGQPSVKFDLRGT
jgi:hypothetical protein